MRVEQVVKRKNGPVVLVVKIFICVCTFLFCNFVFSNVILSVGMYGALIYPICFAVLWLLFRRMDFEFEYCCYDGTLWVDRVTAKSRRSSMAACELRTATAYGPLSELSKAERDSPSVPCVYAQEPSAGEIRYIEYPDGEGHTVRLYFSPGPDLRSALERDLPVSIRR